MLRLILLFFFLLILAIGALFMLGLLRWLGGPASKPGEVTVPETFRTIAFVVLLVLMFGVTSGVLGAG